MRRHWKKIVIGVVAVIAVVIGGSFIYAKWINDAPDPLDEGDLAEAIEGTDPPAASDPVVTDVPASESSSPTGDTATADTAPADDTEATTGVDGDWAATTDSI